MRTIEEVGQLVLGAWYAYWREHGIPGGNERDASIEVAKVVVTAIADDGVLWAPDNPADWARFTAALDRVVKDNDEIPRRLAGD
jgi:hypothetical protein